MLIINSNDYTKYIQDGTYNVMNVDIGDSWVDGNHKTHKNHVIKVQGSFDMSFITEDEYNAFLGDIEDATNNDGYVECSVFVVNANSSKFIECFLTISPKDYKPVNNTNVVYKISVSIEEG